MLASGSETADSARATLKAWLREKRLAAYADVVQRGRLSWYFAAEAFGDSRYPTLDGIWAGTSKQTRRTMKLTAA